MASSNSNDNFNFKKHILQDFDKLLIISIFLLYLVLDFLFQKRESLLLFTYVFSMFLCFWKVYYLVKCYNKTDYIMKMIVIALFNTLLFKYHNPFFNFFFFWIPFQDFFRCILMIKVLNYFPEVDYQWVNRRKDDNNSLSQNSYNEVSSIILTYRTFHTVLRFFSSKRRVFLICLMLIFTKLTLFITNEHCLPSYYSHKIRSKKYFIAANLFNNENILDDWTSEMRQLIDYLGRDNVYVSILENGDSTDKTREKLLDFKQDLSSMGVGNTIIIKKIFNKKNYHRIEFLAQLRKKAIEPIFTKITWEWNEFVILFFNDIIYNWKDIVKLIMTNEMKYDIACGLDFYSGFYDQWVSRDLNGEKFLDFYPYFRDKSTQARVINNEPVRVFSCWNGIAVLNPMPLRSEVVFRSSQISWQSECFLLCKDYWTNGFNRVLINPNVKFAYEYWDYYRVKYFDPIIMSQSYFLYYFKYFFYQDNPLSGDLDSLNVTLGKDWKEYY